MGRQTRRPPTVAGCLLLLLIFCLADCASGTCLSYGHSCWGAHGKRSGSRTMVPAARTTDWYLARLLRRMSGLDMNNLRQPTPMENSDLNAIFRVDAPNEITDTGRLENDNEEMVSIDENDVQKTRNAIPMLDDASLAKAKLLQIMRDASDTN